MIYAISDIHAHFKEFNQRIGELVNLKFFEPENKDKLILLGDYIERGPKSKDTLLFNKTENVIFAHWGIDESWEKNWKLKTSDQDMFQEYTTLNTGQFYKTVVAGHFPTSFLANDPKYHDIFFDGESHYYIDGSVQESGKLNMLIYNEQTNKFHC